MNIKELATSLRASVDKALATSPSPRGKARPAAPKTVDRALERLHGEVRALRVQHKLGIVRTARLLFELQRQLLDAGYAPDLVRKLILSLLLQLFSGKK